MTSVKTLAIDEEGYFLLPDGIRISDDGIGADMLSSIQMDDFGVLHLHYQGEHALVEAFDKPYVAKQVYFEQQELIVQMPYQLKRPLELGSLCVDEWDRFHAKTKTGLPVVFSRAAQAELFHMADSFTDDSLTLGSQTIQTPDYYLNHPEVQDESFWTQKYQETSSPGWDLDRPHPELPSVLQQLKINKCRILVPGCGYGHDAAFLAEKGFIVTGIDMSPVAIEKAQKRYGHLPNLTFQVADAFKQDESFKHSFDIVFEHTFYCAVMPTDRDQVIRQWKYWLAEGGHLLGLFFVVPKRSGPYFGGSEWELRDKLQKTFQFLYWTRLKHSPGWRKGAELMVYAQLRSY